jgi:metallo-beta-lactamase family protein
MKGPCLIMAGAGMYNGGRIVGHLRAGLPHSDATVLFTGFQSRGSLGRALVDGATEVSILGERIPVRASIHTMGGLSGHAEQDDLVRWFDSLATSRPRVILTHGEERARGALHGIIAGRYGIDAERPGLYDVIEL